MHGTTVLTEHITVSVFGVSSSKKQK